jgi:predicted ATPase
VRVAFVGSHRTGKTTLVEAVASQLPGYDVIDEPYHLLEEDGYEFSDPPTVDDFVAQLQRSIDALREPRRDNALFDRCPLDFIAYLQALGEDDEPDGARDAIASLDLIVFVPIEDGIVVGAHEDKRLRRDVDERLHRLVVNDSDLNVVEVSGPVDDRVRQVLSAMSR